jgi:hypothetical protein
MMTTWDEKRITAQNHVDQLLRAPLRDGASLFLEIEHAAGQLQRDSDE